MEKQRKVIHRQQPFKNWVRIRFKNAKTDEEVESEAEKETDRDLTKPIEQLLCDVHEQAVKATERREKKKKENAEDEMLDYVEWMLHAQKRMVSMMARIAISNKWMNILLLIFTGVIFVLTGVIAGLTVVLACYK